MAKPFTYEVVPKIILNCDGEHHWQTVYYDKNILIQKCLVCCKIRRHNIRGMVIKK